MKRTLMLSALLALLSACTVTVAPHRVTVTPAAKTVRPGERVTLTASVNFETDSEILWRLGPEDRRSPNDALTNRTGSTTTYTAPLEDGAYTVTAETVDEASLNGEAKITVDSFLDAERFNATTDSNAAVLTGVLEPRASRVLGIDVSSQAALAGEALFIELGQDLHLSVHNDDQGHTPYASSSSEAYFASGLGGLARSAVDAQSIVAARACRGSCVIRNAEAGTSYIRIVNQTSAAVTYTVFAYVADYGDSGEPENNDRASAIPLSDVDQGAIERLADQDYYRVGAAGDLRFTAPSASPEIASGLRAEVAKADGTVLATLRVGESYDRVIPGDIVRVFEDGGDRAGAAAVSRYVLELFAAQ